MGRRLRSAGGGIGAVLAAGLIAPQSKIVLFGDRPSIEELLAKENFRADAFDIVHTTQVIEMGDNPALTFRQKPDSSIAVGFRHLTEGRIDGFASAGSTGAMMVGCMYTVKQIEGIIRPAISSVIPTIDGRQRDAARRGAERGLQTGGAVSVRRHR